jgi:hypothetical protein
MIMPSSRQLILPAEIRAREFDARILQGFLAAQRGWQVVLGSKVESGCDAVALGSTCLFPPLSSGGASIAGP